MEDAGRVLDCLVIGPTGTEPERWTVPAESPLTLWVNNLRWVTIMCTPVARRQLALGFVYFAGLIGELRDVLVLEECLDDPDRINMRLQRTDISLPNEPLLTSGCGQGLSLAQAWPEGKVAPSEIEAAQACLLMQELQDQSLIHREVGGTHASALSDGKQLLAVYEDIGRHNTVDKLMGHSLLTGLYTSGTILLTSGRISSEMLYKAVKMRVSAIISRTAPTDLAVELAVRYGVTLMGYARGRRLTQFCAPGPS
jgi:FdhD protein